MNETVRSVDQTAIQQFIRRALGEMSSYTFPYIASISGIVQADFGVHLGSAVRCLLKGKRAIATAFHVIEKATKEYPGFAVSVGDGAKPYEVWGQISFCNNADIAVYFLPDDFPDDDAKAYWPQERIEGRSDRLATDYLFAHGFPRTGSYPSKLFGGIVNKSMPYGSMQRVEGLPEDMHAFQFAMHFEVAGMIVEAPHRQGELPNPHGLSGSAVWRLGASGKKMSDWTTESCRLVGILTQWRPKSEILIATRAEELLRLADR